MGSFVQQIFSEQTLESVKRNGSQSHKHVADIVVSQTDVCRGFENQTYTWMQECLHWHKVAWLSHLQNLSKRAPTNHKHALDRQKCNQTILQSIPSMQFKPTTTLSIPSTNKTNIPTKSSPAETACALKNTYHSSKHTQTVQLSTIQACRKQI